MIQISRSFEIKPNNEQAAGASLQAYSRTAYELALMALRPQDTQPLTITPPPGHDIVKRIAERDTIHYVIPGRIRHGMDTEWSGGGLVHSQKLWTPGAKSEDIDGHPNLFLDIPLGNLPPTAPKLPEGSWLGLEVDEEALTRALLWIIPTHRRHDKLFDAANYISHLL